MPKKPMDYSKTIIYKIVCNNLNVPYIYVGHTTSFSKRKYNHKSSCCNENDKAYNCLVYQTIREHGGWNNFSMVEVEKYPCKDFNEASARERYWIEVLTANLNSNVPSRTKREYFEDNREHIAEYQKQYRKQYYEQNRENIAECRKQYYEQNRENIAECRKQHYEQNREKILKQKKQYYENKKQKISQKCYCDCGNFYTNVSKSRHLKSKKHQNYIDNITPEDEELIVCSTIM